MNAKELRARLLAHGFDYTSQEYKFAAEWWLALSHRQQEYYINTHPRQSKAWEFVCNLPDEELMFLWAVFKM